MRQGSEVLSRNDAGGMTLRAQDGTYLKAFRRPRVLSTAHIDPLSARFARASRELNRRGVRTVLVLETFRIPGRQHVVRFQGAEGETLRSVLGRSQDMEHAAALLDRFAAFVAGLHEKGIYFRGLRFDNVVVGSDGSFGLVDVGAARFRRAPVPFNVRARNMRRFLRSDVDRAIIERTGMARFLRAYFESAGLDARAQRALLERLNRPTRRRSWRRMMLLAEGAPGDIAERLWSDADAVMREGAVIKPGDRTTIAEVTSRDGRTFILKRANLKNPLHTALHLLIRSRARWGWLNSGRVSGAGLACATPRILFEERRGPLRLRSFLLSDCVDGTPLFAWVKDRAATDPALLQIADRFADIWRALGRERLAHRDMKATNFLVDREQRIVLLDLDSIRRCPTILIGVFARERRRDRARFLRNWQDRPEVRELFRARIDTGSAPGE